MSLKLLRQQLMEATKLAAERVLSLEEIGACVYAAGLAEGLSARSTELDAGLAKKAVLALEPLSKRRVQFVRVTSDSDPKVIYYVSRVIGTEPGPWRCTCPGFTYHHHCKHVARMGVSHGSSSVH